MIVAGSPLGILFAEAGLLDLICSIVLENPTFIKVYMTYVSPRQR